MAFLGSLFKSMLPAIANVATNLTSGIPILGDVVKGVSSLVGGDSNPAPQPSQMAPTSSNIVNPGPTSVSYASNPNLVGGESMERMNQLSNMRLEGLVDSLLSRVGSKNTVINDLVKKGSSAIVKKAKSRSSKFDELARALGV